MSSQVLVNFVFIALLQLSCRPSLVIKTFVSIPFLSAQSCFEWCDDVQFGCLAYMKMVHMTW